MPGHDSIPPSEPPPSSRIPGRSSGNGPYIFGIIALAAMSAALLLYWKQCRSAPRPAPTATAATPTQTARGPSPDFAPPPPPEPEELEDAGPEAAPTATAVTPSNGDGPCMGCGKGISSPELESKVASRAGLARGCYNRALRTSEVSGSLTLSVSVGADGSVCGTRIVKDTVGSPAISSCVQSKFSGVSFPRPKVGCVVINVPIAFKTKK